MARRFVAAVGTLLLVYGITGVVFGSADFATEPGGTVEGFAWLGVKGNGWTNLLFAVLGTVLIAGSPTDTGASLAAALVALVLAALAVIASIDGAPALGVFAANGWTIAASGVLAAVLAVSSLFPRPRSDTREPDVAGGWAGSRRSERDLLGTHGR